MLRIVAAIAVLFAVSAPAEARHHHRHHHHKIARYHAPAYAHETAHARHVRATGRRAAGSSVLTGGISTPLTEKAAEIVRACGSTVISGYRPGAVVAGTGRPSLHASGRAFDIRGNPNCIYSMLRGWPGGYSVDYGAVSHVHVSLGGREDGARFSHGGGGRHHHRHHRRAPTVLYEAGARRPRATSGKG